MITFSIVATLIVLVLVVSMLLSLRRPLPKLEFCEACGLRVTFGHGVLLNHRGRLHRYCVRCSVNGGAK